MSTSLVGLRVLVSISDPWEFVTNNGGSRAGTVVGEHADVVESSPTLRIHLDERIEDSGNVSDAVFARFRHVSSGKQQLLSKQLVPCNFSTEMGGTELSGSAKAIAFIGGLHLLS